MVINTYLIVSIETPPLWKDTPKSNCACRELGHLGGGGMAWEGDYFALLFFFFFFASCFRILYHALLVPIKDPAGSGKRMDSQHVCFV